MASSKLDDKKYGEIKNFLRFNSQRQAATKFGLGLCTINDIAKYATFEIYKKERAERSRKYFEKRKEEIKGSLNNHKTVSPNPFPNSAKPTPIVPIEPKQIKDMDGPVTVISPQRSNDTEKKIPFTFEQYKKAYNESQKENGVLNGKLAKSNMELKQATILIEHLRTEVQRLEAEKEKLVKHLREEFRKAKEVSTASIPSTPENNSETTKIEITVGQAKIVVTGEKCGLSSNCKAQY